MSLIPNGVEEDEDERNEEEEEDALEDPADGGWTGEVAAVGLPQ